jgi:hypothetical protein
LAGFSILSRPHINPSEAATIPGSKKIYEPLVLLDGIPAGLGPVATADIISSQASAGAKLPIEELEDMSLVYSTVTKR